MVDRERFEEIVRQEGQRIYHLAYRLSQNMEEARDIAQETFLRAYRSLHRFREEAAFSTYLYRIACNVWKNRIRQTSRRRIFSLSGPDPDGRPAPDPADPLPDPARAMEKEERVRILRACLGSLPESDRMILVLRDIEDRPYEEIARILNCRLGTVKSRLARARENLRVHLLPYRERLRE